MGIHEERGVIFLPFFCLGLFYMFMNKYSYGKMFSTFSRTHLYLIIFSLNGIALVRVPFWNVLLHAITYYLLINITGFSHDFHSSMVNSSPGYQPCLQMSGH